MKKRNIIIVSIVIVLILIITIGAVIWHNKNTGIKIDKDFSKIDLSNVTNVMFVAHPDDDALWGGKHLVENGDKYLVVCITCGVVKQRADEFESAMNKTNSKYIMLGWPDKTNGEKDNWDSSYDGITKDVQDILALKDWKLIVTHNPDGEYGHIHHKMTNAIVTDNAKKEKLMYFGKYHKKADMEKYQSSMIPMDADSLEKKEDLISVYKSQDFVFDMFGHMNVYENWLSYEEWYNEN